MHLYVYVCMYMCVCIYIYTCVCVFICVYTILDTFKKTRLISTIVSTPPHMDTTKNARLRDKRRRNRSTKTKT